MEINEHYIEAFIKGELNEQEQREAEARYAAEPEFKQAVDEMRLQYHLARLSHATHVAEQVQAARQRHEAAAPAPKARLRRWYWAAAAAAAILIVAIGWYWSQRPSYTEALYAETFKPRKCMRIVAGPTVSIPEAYRLYSEALYQQAIPLFEAIPQGTPAGDSARFFLANCQMQEGNFESALRELQALEARYLETESFGQDIRWYLALALLHEGRVEEVKHYLSVLVVQPDGSNVQAAQDLLRKLE